MGRSSKKNKSKRQSDESDELAVKSKRKKLQEFTVTKSSPRKSTSGKLNLTLYRLVNNLNNTTVLHETSFFLAPLTMM